MVIVSVGATFGIENSQHQVRIFGSNGAEILSAEMFSVLIEKYISSPESYLRIEFAKQNSLPLRVTGQDLKLFLIENGGVRIVNDLENCKEYNDRTKNKLIDLLVDFMIQRFGIYPTATQKKQVAKATLELFKVFHVKKSKLDGIVRLHPLLFFVGDKLHFNFF